MSSPAVSLEARSELELLNAEFESFNYSISHDLRAPVRAVLGFTRALEDDYGAVLDAEGRRLLAIIGGEAERMAAMIDDLLAISRLSRQPMVWEPIDMLRLVQTVVAEQVGVADQGRAIVEIADLTGVPGDFDLLRVAWQNVLGNAVKYSSKRDEPHVRVWSVLDGDRVVYHISDNGVGFDMQYADKLFGVFQKLHRSDDFPGTGAGLAQVQRIIHRHGGTVWAEAQLDRGATFSFSLPAERDA